MIIYSNKINSTSLLKSLSLSNKDCFDVRVNNLNELLEDINIKLGFPFQKNVFSKKDIEERVYPFFIKEMGLDPLSYQDITHFISTLNNVRKQIVVNNELNYFKSKFASNIKEDKSLSLLYKFYCSYLSSLGDNDDQILYLREIIKLSRDKKIYDSIYYFAEDDISPLEEMLLNSVAYKVYKISVLSLFEPNEKKTQIKNIIPTYGSRNEINHVIGDIYKNKYHLDDCLIVVTNVDQYIYQIYEASKSHNIKVTYQTGLPICLSDPYKLYRSIKLLGEKYFYDVNGYLNFLSNESLDIDKLNITNKTQIANLLGRLKVSFDKNNNDVVLSNLETLQKGKYFDFFLSKIDRNIAKNKQELLENLLFIINEFSKGIGYVISNYSKNNLGDLAIFETSKKYIVETIDYVNSDVFPKELRDSYLASIGNKYINHEINDDKSLHVCNISQALSIYRKHVYFIGLNASNYPGDLKQDFLFSDDYYLKLTNITNYSVTQLNKKNILLKTIIDQYLTLGSEVILSYNSQEIKEARELNACSVLLDYAEDLYQEENKKLAKDKLTVLMLKRNKCSYYDDGINPISTIGDISLSNDGVIHQDLKIKQEDRSDNYDDKYTLLTKPYSPSTMPNFIACPMRFYLDNIEHIDNSITYDPLRPISGSRFGDLFHYVFERYVKNKGNMTLQELVMLGTDLYDSYALLDRSIGDKDLSKKEMINAINNAYSFLKDFDLTNATAEKYCLSDINNLYFSGSIDLVALDKEGNTVIIDYKTGSHIEHVDNDMDTCIQGVIYSYLYEKETGIKPIKLIFYYAKFAKAIVFDNPNSNDNKQYLEEKASLFLASLKNKSFPAREYLDEEGICKYCHYKKICKREKKPKGGNVNHD